MVTSFTPALAAIFLVVALAKQNTAINIKKKMEADFQRDNPKYKDIVEEDKDDDYYSEINDYVKKHQERYVSLYQDCLSNHNMEAMFIKVNKQR